MAFETGKAETIAEIAAIRSDLEDILAANSGLQDALRTLRLRLVTELAEHCRDNPWDLVNHHIRLHMHEYAGNHGASEGERTMIFNFVDGLLHDDEFLASLLVALRVRG